MSCAVATRSAARERAPRTGAGPVPRYAFALALATLFAAGVSQTLEPHASTQSMGAMPMPGTVPSPWAPLPGQGWAGAATSFLGMWVAMTVAMMLPSATRALWRYRDGVARDGVAHPGLLAGLAGAAYLMMWAVAGAIVFPVGAALAAARLPPAAGGVALLLAGAWQLTARKARHLACCRRGGERVPPPGTAQAIRFGMHLGLHCARCCANLMAVPLVLGIMDLRVMTAAGAAITLERLAPAGGRVARVTGVVILGAGIVTIARVAGAG